MGARRFAASSSALVPLGALIACWLLAPLLPAPHSLTSFRIAAYASTAVFFALVLVALVHAVALVRTSGRRIALLALGLAALVMALNLLAVPVASDLAKLAFGAVAGAGVVRVVERPWWLLPVAVCVPIADAWSVFSQRGVTHHVVARAKEDPAWLDWPSVAVPIAGLDYGDFGRIGITDLVFVALFVAAAARWGLGVRRTATALAVGFVATEVWAVEGSGTAIPALPLLCLAFLAVTVPALVRDLRADLATRH